MLTWVATATVDGDVDGNRIHRLRAIIEDPVRGHMVYFELGAISIMAKPFITATYNSEGNGPISLVVADMVEELRIRLELCAEDASFHGMDAVIDTCATNLVAAVGAVPPPMDAVLVAAAAPLTPKSNGSNC